RTEILVPLAAIQAVPIAVIAWYRLHRYAWYRYSAIVTYIDAFKQKRNDRDNIKFESSLRWQYIYVSLCNHCMYQLGLDIHEKAKDETWTRFSVKNQDGANILILSIINQANDKSICVRFLNQDSTQNDATSILASLQRVDAKFKSIGSWIGKIDLSKSLSDTDTFIIETKKLLTNVIAEISGLN
ncbi:hypothetical protein ACTQ1W_12970, partial [Segatella copri]